MTAGRELDALVAERVMGICPRQVRIAGTIEEATIYTDSAFYGPVVERRHLHHVEPRPYSTDMAAAWLVVARMAGLNIPARYRNLSMVAYCYSRTYATFDADAFENYSETTWVEANGEHHTSLAICLAALRALDVEVTA